MTHLKITTLDDGVRVYSNGFRYKPLTLEQRKYGVRKPDVPGAVMYNKEWFVPLVLLSDTGRRMPETRPDTDAYEHMAKPRKCMCYVCRRPEAEVWKQKWLRALRNGLPPSLR